MNKSLETIRQEISFLRRRINTARKAGVDPRIIDLLIRKRRQAEHALHALLEGQIAADSPSARYLVERIDGIEYGPFGSTVSVDIATEGSESMDPEYAILREQGGVMEVVATAKYKDALIPLAAWLERSENGDGVMPFSLSIH